MLNNIYFDVESFKYVWNIQRGTKTLNMYINHLHSYINHYYFFVNMHCCGDETLDDNKLNYLLWLHNQSFMYFNNNTIWEITKNVSNVNVYEERVKGVLGMEISRFKWR